MKVLVLSNVKLETREIENTLEAFQGIVGGYIEIPYLSKRFSDSVIDVVINEEGKFIDGLRPEIVVVDKATQQTLDIVYGNCIFVSHDDEGNFIELNDEQIKIIMEELKIVVASNGENGHIAKVLYV